MTTRAGDMLQGLDKEAVEQRIRAAAQTQQAREQGRKVVIRDVVTGRSYETRETVRKGYEPKTRDYTCAYCWDEGVCPVLIDREGYHTQVTWLRCTCSAAERFAKRDSAGQAIPGRYVTASYYQLLGAFPEPREEAEKAIQRWLAGGELPAPPAPVSPPSYYDPDERREAAQGDIWAPLEPDLSPEQIRERMAK